MPKNRQKFFKYLKIQNFSLAGFFLTLLFLCPVFVFATTETFNSSTTWTAPAGVTSVQVEVWGGGGGGGGGSQDDSPGGGGGGGAYSIDTSITVTPSSNYTVTVGSG